MKRQRSENNNGIPDDLQQEKSTAAEENSTVVDDILNFSNLLPDIKTEWQALLSTKGQDKLIHFSLDGNDHDTLWRVLEIYQQNKNLTAQEIAAKFLIDSNNVTDVLYDTTVAGYTGNKASLHRNYRDKQLEEKAIRETIQDRNIFLYDNPSIGNSRVKLNLHERLQYIPLVTRTLDATRKCRFCNHLGVYISSKQTRGADESETRFAQCSSDTCGQKWID